MISSTPATALTSTKRNTEMRCIHSWIAGGWCSSPGSIRSGRSSAAGPGSGAFPGALENVGSVIQGKLRSQRQPRHVLPITTMENSHRAILRLQGLYALGDVAVINVRTVNVHEVLQSGGL